MGSQLRIFREARSSISLTATHRLILCTIDRQGDLGATDEEITVATAVAGNTLRPRRIELSYAGLVADSGVRRRSSRGRPVTVWVATETGKWEASHT